MTITSQQLIVSYIRLPWPWLRTTKKRHERLFQSLPLLRSAVPKTAVQSRIPLRSLPDAAGFHFLGGRAAAANGAGVPWVRAQEVHFVVDPALSHEKRLENPKCSMKTPLHCPTCGRKLPVSGHCTPCLLAIALSQNRKHALTEIRAQPRLSVPIANELSGPHRAPGGSGRKGNGPRKPVAPKIVHKKDHHR